MKEPLPVDEIIPEILTSLRMQPNLVIEAPPGSGKTTRIPSAILESLPAGTGEILVLEPRRLAARMAAKRVAFEHNEEPGELVGFQVRFEEVSGPKTRLKFLTEGILTRRLLTDPKLRNIGAVVLDEFHERHLQTDLAIALLRRLQLGPRPDLRLVVMSATLEADRITSFLGGCPTIKAEGRTFDVSIEYCPKSDDLLLAKHLEAVLRKFVNVGLTGDVLVFLPGAAEIRRAMESCSSIGASGDLDLVPLHGELSSDEQDRAIRPSSKRKIIFSTNVAESSITIEGIDVVIDSGLARFAGHSPWSGLPVFNIGRISKSSAKQRAGRAGRTRPGRCIRLYSEQDFAARPEHDVAEILRSDLSEMALEIRGAGVSDLRGFSWFQNPPESSIEAADALLSDLGAIDGDGRLSATGAKMLRLPVHPRLSRLLIEAEARGVGIEGCTIAALVSERDIRSKALFEIGRNRTKSTSFQGTASNIFELLDLYRRAERSHFAADTLRLLGLDHGRVRSVDRVHRQLQRMLGKSSKLKSILSTEDENSLALSVLSGYPDRVAQWRSSDARDRGRGEVALSGGGVAQLDENIVIPDNQLFVAVQADEQPATGRSARRIARVKLALAIEPEWLLELYPDKVIETRLPVWNREALRVEIVERLMFGQIVLDELRRRNISTPETSRLLFQTALETGLEKFLSGKAAEELLDRLAFLRKIFPESEFPEMTIQRVRECFEELCEGRLSFDELHDAIRAGALIERIRLQFSPKQLSLLAEMAPTRIPLGPKRQVQINYSDGQNPWIASRIQDFFGLKDAPSIAGGRVRLVLHLLAPNQRPVQVTSDLSGFWQRHYPQLRRELGRRYPRHAWPEDPLIP
ncbi:MAG: ATP-dependent helicase HrpB [Blastocatellia bacterium]|nr:ATP-dependent helicase HrpB [Blastocatellia bacterium]